MTSPSFVAVITLASGALFLLLAVFKMGWIAQFLSRAVVTGFLFGAAIDVVIGELPKLTGTEVIGLEPAPGAVVVARDARRRASAHGGRRRRLARRRLRAAADRAPHPGSARPGRRGAPGCLGCSISARTASRSWATCRAGCRRSRSRTGSCCWDHAGTIALAAVALVLIGFSQTAGDCQDVRRRSTATASTSTRSRSPRAWRTSAPACSRGCRSRRACPPAR